MLVPQNLKKKKKMGPNAERLVKILDVIVYLFVDTYVPIVYRVKSSNQKYDYHINRCWSLKIFKNGTERRKARQNFGCDSLPFR
jgi:hypothetical protein